MQHRLSIFLKRLRIAAGTACAAAFLLAGASCAGPNAALPSDAAVRDISRQPVTAEDWDFAGHPGALLTSPHYRVYTTLDSQADQRLILRLLETSYATFQQTCPGRDGQNNHPMPCYVFANRWEWERFTRQRAGSNAPIYLQITAGGYCQSGMFAGYDIGREQTLSVIGHEAWHQYSWYAFKDRLPSWLEEGIATQHEAIVWDGTTPRFDPAQNYRRFNALRSARREGYLWDVKDLLGTHAGRVIMQSQRKIDAYYAQLWSLVLFLQHSQYKPGFDRLLADAQAGELLPHLKGKGVSKLEVALFTERWNSIAGPTYFHDYITDDLATFQEQYEAYVDHLTQTFPATLTTPATDH